MPDTTAWLERDMPSGTPRLKDIPKTDGGDSGPSVLLVAGTTAAAAVSVLCSHNCGDLL